MPAIERRELEHSFIRVFDELSGHLVEIMGAEERGATAEDDGTDEVLVSNFSYMCRELVVTQCDDFVQLEEDFKNFPVGRSSQHIMDEESEVGGGR